MDISSYAIKSKLPELLSVALISILRRDTMFNLDQWCFRSIELDEFYQVASFSCFGPVHQRIHTAFTKKNRVFAFDQHFRSGSNNRHKLKGCPFDRARRDLSWSALFSFWSGAWANPYNFYENMMQFSVFFLQYFRFFAGLEKCWRKSKYFSQ